MLMEICNKYYLNCVDPIFDAFVITLFIAIKALFLIHKCFPQYMKTKITTVSLGKL